MTSCPSRGCLGAADGGSPERRLAVGKSLVCAAGLPEGWKGAFSEAPESTSVCPVESEAPASSEGGVRPLRLWELEVYLKCPVVGLCLTKQEQHQLLKRFGVQTKRMSPFDVHEVFVACGENENRLSLRVQGFLERKYARRCRELSGMDEPSLLREWGRDFAAGRMGESFWPLVTHPALSDAGRRKVFGDVHMAMHDSLEDRGLRLREIQELREAREGLSAKLRDSETACRRLEADVRALEKESAVLLRRVEEAEGARAASGRDRPAREVERMARPEEERQRLLARAEVAEERLAAREGQMEVLKARVEELEREREQKDLFIRETHCILEGMKGQGGCDPNCPAYDLCSKRVLIVGGIARMETLYRRLVEENGGVFEYHDGKVRGGSRQLEERLKRADMVLCPVTCNSHAACLLVKNLGKKYNKPVRMLENHSVSSLARAMGS